MKLVCNRASLKHIFFFVFNSKAHAFPPILNIMLKEKKILKKIIEIHNFP